MELGKFAYTKRHPLLLPREHRVVELLITYKHLRLLNAGPTLRLLLNASASYVVVKQYAPEYTIVLHASVLEQELSRSY